MKILFKQSEALEMINFINESNLNTLDVLRNFDSEVFSKANYSDALIAIDSLVEAINLSCKGYAEIRIIEATAKEETPNAMSQDLDKIAEYLANRLEDTKNNEDSKNTDDYKNDIPDESLLDLDFDFDYDSYTEEKTNVEPVEEEYKYELIINSEYINDSLGVYKVIMREACKLAVDAYRSYKFVIEGAITKFIYKYTKL